MKDVLVSETWRSRTEVTYGCAMNSSLPSLPSRPRLRLETWQLGRSRAKKGIASRIITYIHPSRRNKNIL
ncbi:unnamed protein product [Lupinus luteus]|uniref:Uncharacterized protein n=1 Tax=Lupinus luteus TaxID=3873 RepID=A0AAV1WUW2_LUPLU